MKYDFVHVRCAMTESIKLQWKNYNYLCSEIDACYHEAALKLGLSDSALLVLYAICSNGDSCPVSDISRLSGTRRQTINSALRKLEAEGLVYLEGLQGRRKRVCLTEQGRRFAGGTALRVLEIEEEIFASWPQEDREKYIELTRRYLTSFKTKLKEF